MNVKVESIILHATLVLLEQESQEEREEKSEIKNE